MSKPDVIVLMVDQLAQKWLEVAAAGVCDLPNLRRLQASGTTFTHAISSNPICCPARATLATGLTSRGHGVIENGYCLDPAIPTFAQMLQKAGWRTGAFGKLHLRPHFAGLRPDYAPYGYHVTHITEDGRGGEWLDWVEANHGEHYEAVLATVWASDIPDFAEYGPLKRDLRSRIEAIRQKFNWASSEFPYCDADHYLLPFPEEVSQTNWITDLALEFIRETPADTPIHAHISYVQPHRPLCCPAEYLDCVADDRIPEPVAAEWVEDPHAPAELKCRTPICPDAWRFYRQLYFGDLVHLDRQLGRIFEALEQTGRADNALVVFCSDHGEMLYDHGLQAKGEKHYDACIRVPLVVTGPGLARGGQCDRLVQLEDICPTILEMTGQALPPMPKMGASLPTPAKDIPQLPGRSLLGLCRGEQVDDWREAAYCESYNNLDSLDPSQWARTIRTQRYRYTFYPAGGGEQLFDLREDPDELHNVVVDPARAEIRHDLRGLLLERIVLQDYPKCRRALFAMGVH